MSDGTATAVSCCKFDATIKEYNKETLMWINTHVVIIRNYDLKSKIESLLCTFQAIDHSWNATMKGKTVNLVAFCIHTGSFK